MSKIVRKTLDEVRKTPISRARLADIAAMPDNKIDLSDIPELTEKFGRIAMPNPFYNRVFRKVPARLVEKS